MFKLIHMLQVCLVSSLCRPFLAAQEMTLSFHPEMFVSNLKYMGLGMLCIIIVMAVIIGIVLLLNRITSLRKKTDDKQ